MANSKIASYWCGVCSAEKGEFVCMLVNELYHAVEEPNGTLRYTSSKCEKCMKKYLGGEQVLLYYDFVPDINIQKICLGTAKFKPEITDGVTRELVASYCLEQ